MNPADSSPSSETPSGPFSPGQLLRAAREAKGVHLAVLSVALKVPTRKLEALEKDDHSGFQDVTFLRALAQSVCRQLDIDPSPVLAGLPRSAASITVQRPLLGSRMPAVSRDAHRRRWRAILPSKVVLVLAFLMLTASGLLIWWPASIPGPVIASAVSDDKAEVSVPMGPASNSQDIALLPEAGEPALSPGFSSTQSAEPPASASSVSLRPVGSASLVVRPTAASAESAEPALQVRPKMDTWIEVRDSTSQVLVKRLVKGGEILRHNVQAPVFVYVGRADSTELLWQGQVLDLKPHTQNNEARLNIKP